MNSNYFIIRVLLVVFMVLNPLQVVKAERDTLVTHGVVGECVNRGPDIAAREEVPGIRDLLLVGPHETRGLEGADPYHLTALHTFLIGHLEGTQESRWLFAVEGLHGALAVGLLRLVEIGAEGEDEDGVIFLFAAPETPRVEQIWVGKTRDRRHELF